MSPDRLEITPEHDVEIEVDVDIEDLNILVETRDINLEVPRWEETDLTVFEKPDVIVISPGFQGPAGPEGPAGPSGPAGPMGPEGQQTTYTFTQLAPAHIWDVQHNLHRYPSVTVIDSGGSEVLPTIHYISDNYIQLEFDNITSGKAYLN